jgi:hypothetical protein
MAVPAGAPVRYPPNVLFVVAGIVVFVAGVGLAALGVVGLVEVSDPFHGNGPDRVADGSALVAWGCIVLTDGRYLWRAARRRGWRDRLGRVLIIVGYAILGLGIDVALHIAVGIWAAADPNEGRRVAVEFALTFTAFGLVAVAFVMPGIKLASEKILLRASAGVQEQTRYG